MNDLELLKYPIGRFAMPTKITDEDVQEYIKILENLPTELTKTVENFDDEKFNTPYRENGWTVQQVITHVAEAHSIAYVRFKQGLEENKIVAKLHNEKKVSDYSGIKNTAVQKALQTITNVHDNWVLDLKSLSEQQLKLSFFYPDAGRQMSLPEFLAIFAWHSKHHFAHIKSLKDRMEW
ncbi:YfiT family bacillithiol transferase [Chryseobacterium sp. VAUSW3]|uniref:YfiT family bacillithiol transferase n=1 Tax=Chryseobacterium sp. VAUSW3 TaxID=2010998 RepID=UPI000B4D8010|nr:putative metal-dependent hydrolase [Chryseobacterium sp. VAUSW3]OWR14544.1 metal-dependent hydrolase [Chryseobacterium sp. VAUSW3]